MGINLRSSIFFFINEYEVSSSTCFGLLGSGCSGGVLLSRREVSLGRETGSSTGETQCSPYPGETGSSTGESRSRRKCSPGEAVQGSRRKRQQHRRKSLNWAIQCRCRAHFHNGDRLPRYRTVGYP